MNVTVKRKELLKLFAAIAKITKIDSSTFIKLNIYYERVEISFIVGLTKITNVIFGECSSGEQKECFVDLKILDEYIKLETAENITIDLSNYNALVIRTENGEYCLPTNEDMFELKDPSREIITNSLTFKAETFITGGNIVSPFASKEKHSRLSSVLVMAKEKQSIFVATDGYVLAEYRKNYMFDKVTFADSLSFESVAIPLQAFQAIESFIEKDTASVKFYQEEMLNPDDEDEEKRYTAVIGDTMISFVSAGEYPDYLKIYPNCIIGSAIVDRKKLINLCKKIHLFCLSGSATFELDYKANNIKVSADEVEGLEYSAEDSIDAAMNNSSKFKLNASVVADALGKIKINSPKYDMVTLDYGMEGDKNPVIFKAYSDHHDTSLRVFITQAYQNDEEEKIEENEQV